MFDSFYGLRGRPFQLTPDPAFYFESLTHRKAMSYLSYGLAQAEGFIVITGDMGTGKSTLVAHLVTLIDRQRLTAAKVLTSKLSGEEMVHVVAQAFGLAVAGHDKAMALGAIEAFLHAEARQGRRCLLVVDESQNLSIGAIEELRMLSNFQLGAQPLLQILLLGQPEFRDLLQGNPNLEQLRQRVIAAHHLEAMEPDEIEPYILHRLRLVGWAGNPSFEPRLFGEIYSATKGVPRRVNQIVNQLLMLGAVERKSQIDGVDRRGWAACHHAPARRPVRARARGFRGGAGPARCPDCRIATGGDRTGQSGRCLRARRRGCGLQGRDRRAARTAGEA
jgi:general secretion pathway protein A